MTTTLTRTYQLTHAQALDLAAALRFRAGALELLAEGDPSADDLLDQARGLRHLVTELLAPWEVTRLG
jgi:hypothetical protein